jgi:hypothetical protein
MTTVRTYLATAFLVMPGLDPGIHEVRGCHFVDGRVEPGHDRGGRR